MPTTNPLIIYLNTIAMPRPDSLIPIHTLATHRDTIFP